MKITDKLYGSFEINEPVLIDLLNSESLERLQNISVGGYYSAYPFLQDEVLTRYKHSIGVFLLLRKFGASLNEQIAGLIHDVSHSAFSHTIDYIKDNLEEQKNQNGQDNFHNDFVKKSDIKDILIRHRFDLEEILDDSKFTLKENNIPNICADRIDYFLRGAFFSYNKINKSEKDKILNSLIVHNRSFIFKDFETAKLFATKFYETDKVAWSGILSAIMFSITGLLLKYSIENNYIKIEDLYKFSDAEIIFILMKYIKTDEKIKEYFHYLDLPVEEFENNEKNYIRHICCKIRNVDPFFIENGKIYRVSERDDNYKLLLDTSPKFKEYYIALKE